MRAIRAAELTMSEPDHPNPNPSPPPVAAEGPDLQDQVDHLLDDVEALTEETLGETETGETRASAEVPTTDPAKEIAADDVGLSSESPLVQDGERTSVEEVAADVDQELDQMERLISGIEGETSPDDAGTSGQNDVPSAVPGEVSEPESPSDAEDTPASDADVIGSIEEEPAAPEPAGDAGPDPIPPASADDADTGLDEDIAEIVASTLGADPQPEPDILIGSQIPSDPEAPQTAESANETTLDQDIDALLACSEVADLEAPIEDVAPPADPGDTPATTDTAAPKPRAAPQLDIDLESIPIWRVLKLKLKARSRHLSIMIRRRATDALVGLLERIDAKIGNKLPPMIRELIGYCALATLAMAVIALIIFLI